jgi:outer membrane protein assembly factor BamB
LSTTPLLLSDNTLCCGGDQGGVFGLDALTGLEKWRNASLKVTALNLNAKKQLVVAGRNSIDFLNPQTGAVVGGVSTGVFNTQTATGPDGTLYFVTKNNVHELRAVDPVSGTLRWTFPLTFSNNDGTPVVGADGTVYFMGYKTEGSAIVYLFALDGATGAVRAERRMNGTQIALGAGNTIFVSGRGKVTALSPTLTVLWEKSLDSLTDGGFPNTSRLVVGGDNTLYTYTEANNTINPPNYVVALNSADGTQKWRYEFVGRNFGGIALGPDGTVYLATNVAPTGGAETTVKIHAIR